MASFLFRQGYPQVLKNNYNHGQTVAILSTDINRPNKKETCSGTSRFEHYTRNETGAKHLWSLVFSYVNSKIVDSSSEGRRVIFSTS